MRGKNSFSWHMLTQEYVSILLKRGQIGFIFHSAKVPEEASKDGGLQ